MAGNLTLTHHYFSCNRFLKEFGGSRSCSDGPIGLAHSDACIREAALVTGRPEVWPSAEKVLKVSMRRRRRACGPYLGALLGCLLLLVVGGEGAATPRKRLPDKGASGQASGDGTAPSQEALNEALSRVKAALAEATGEGGASQPPASELLQRYRELAFQDTGLTAGAALHDLATFYMDGNPVLGVARDLDMALELVVRAAKDYGNPQAQHLLAMAYATGVLGKVDLAEEGAAVEEGEGPSEEVKAIMHDHFGAMGGDVGGAMSLGYRYLYGHGTPASCESAVLYYEIAANAAIEEMYRLKVLPPNERTRISDMGPGSNKQGPKHRAGEADQQLVEYYEHTAEKGDMGAQVALGRLYYHGSQGVEQNFEKAAVHFERAAKAGDPTAAGSMGQMYAQGVGVAQNNETALRYFRQGELSGDAASLNGLGFLYLYGMGVERSVDRAAKYFHKAAHEKGNSDAFFNLGLIYAGIVTQSTSSSPTAGEEGTAAAGGGKETAGEAGEASGGIKAGVEGRGAKAAPRPSTSGAAMPEASVEGGGGIPAAAGAAGATTTTTMAAGGAAAPSLQQQQGVVGEKGEGVKKNLQKALKYFSLSAQAGHMAALHKIGQMYSQGIATGKSCSTAVHAFKGVAERGSWVKNLSRAYNKYKKGDLESALLDYIKMAELGYEVAQSNAAILLGDHVCLNLSPLDCQRLSFRYYRHASKQGNAEASLKVGDAYYYGKAGLTVDYERAAKYYQAAAELRQPQAMFNLGYMHQHGIGLKQDFHLSKRFYDSAAETHPDARWPVHLALIGLYLHWWYQKDAHDDIITTGPAATHATSAADLRSAGGSGAVEGSVWDWVLRGLGSERQQGEEAWEAMAKTVTDVIARLADTLAPPASSSSEPLRRAGGEGGGGARWGEVLPAMDTLAILVLSTLFLLVMRARMQQAERRRRGGVQLQGQGGGGGSAAPAEEPAAAVGGEGVLGQEGQVHQHQD